MKQTDNNMESSRTGTKDLCLQLLDKQGIEYEQDNENKDEYWIEYKGERMYLRMSNERLTVPGGWKRTKGSPNQERSIDNRA